MIELDSQARALIESAANLRAQIAAREAQIEMMKSYATSENPGMTQAEQELDGLRAQLARLGGSEEDSSAGLIAPKGVLPQIGVEYLRRTRDVKYYEAIFDVLARQYELAKLDEAKEGALIQTVAPAAIPDRRSFPQRGLFVAAGVAFGFIAGFVLAFVGAALDHLRKDPETDAKLDFLRRSYSVRNSRQ
jgi:tyrosine-protein kinase Etk/Wzc